MDHSIRFIEGKVLASGTDDWVHVAEVCFAARQAVLGERLRDGYPNDETLEIEQLASLRKRWTAAQERECFPLAIRAVKEMIRSGLVQIGSLTNAGFIQWGGSLEEIESRLDSVVEAAEFPLQPGDLFWLQNTPDGDEVARQS
jgi:hypothetical protein